MGTRSRIAIRNADNTYLSVYCHWDGYPSHHAPILQQHYDTEDKVRALLAGGDFSSQPHLHRTTFQLVYVLKGWIEFEYEGQGTVRLVAGDSVHQPPGIRHRERGHSDDVELLEVVMPGDFKTELVDSVDG